MLRGSLAKGLVGHPIQCLRVKKKVLRPPRLAAHFRLISIKLLPLLLVPAALFSLRVRWTWTRARLREGQESSLKALEAVPPIQITRR